MIITCEACGTNYRLKTSRVKASGSKVRCSKCQHVFIVYPPAVLSEKITAHEPAKGVEGTATMEFFGAIEADARNAERQQALAAEGDTISGLDEMIAKEDGTMVRKDAGSGQLFDEAPSFSREPGEVEISFSDLEEGPTETGKSGPGSAAVLDMGELTREPDFAGGGEVDLGELTSDAPASGAGVLDIGEFTREGRGSGEPAAAIGAEAVLDMGELTREPEVSGIGEMDLGELTSEAPAGGAEVLDIGELTREGRKSDEPAVGLGSAAVLDMGELTREPGVSGIGEMDLGELTSEAPAGGAEVLDIGELTREGRKSDEPAVGPGSAAVLDMGELTREPDFAGGGEVDLGELTSEGTPEIDPAELSDSSAEEAIFELTDLEARESEEGLGGAEPDLEDLEDLEAPLFAGQPEAEAEATGVDVEDMAISTEDEELFGESDFSAEASEASESPEFSEPEPELDLDAYTVMAETSEFTDATEEFEAEPGEDEMKGGGDTDLDDFELEDEEPELEKSFGSPPEEAGTDEFELDLEFDSPGEKGLEEELEAETEDEDDDFFLDMDLGSDSEEAESLEGLEDEDAEFELDLAEPAPEATGPQEPEEELEEEFELDLDFDESPAEAAEAGDGELFDFDLETDFGAEEAPVSETSDEDWALDLDEFDLDLETEEMSSETVDLDEDDFDLGFDLDAEDEATEVLDTLDIDEALADSEAGQTPASDEAQGEFELEFDLDFDSESEEPDAEDDDEVFELNLDLEPETEDTEDSLDFGTDEATLSSGDEADFELDFDLAPEEETVAASQTQESSAGGAAETEEFDLSEIEDFLEEDAPEASYSRTLSESTELELDLADEPAGRSMGPETEPETETGGASEGELDFETMLDEEEQWSAGEDNELSMESVEGREASGDAAYAGLAASAAAGKADGFDEKDDGATESPREGPTFKRRKRSRVKALLIALLVLLLLGALGVGGLYYFGYGDRIPYLGTYLDRYLGSYLGGSGVSGPEMAETADPGNQRMAVTPNPEYRFIDNENAGELMVLSGEVTNRYDQPRSFVKLRAELYDAEGQVLRETTAFAGNTIAEPELTGGSLEDLQVQLANRAGDDNANVGIAPGQSVPFMVIFENLPEEMAEFSVAVVSSAKAE